MTGHVTPYCFLQVPTVAIEHVFFLNNTSIIAVRCLREHIVHRMIYGSGQSEQLTLQSVVWPCICSHDCPALTSCRMRCWRTAWA